ncbi:MAG TPA: hypothetical protein VMV86_01770 [Methanosarcinales archaeon]|nr:hypothetical protein [Methanosarcinales archaeon]
MELTDLIKKLDAELVGVTTVQRAALGTLLLTLNDTRHIMVYDINEKTFYVWSGQEWT